MISCELVQNYMKKSLAIVSGYFKWALGSSSSGYGCVQEDFGYGSRNVEDEWILEFTDAMEKVVTNTSTESFRVSQKT